MYFLAHLGERANLRELTEDQLIGRSQFGEAWIREHHEVSSPSILPQNSLRSPGTLPQDSLHW